MPLEVPPGESGSDELPDELDDAEKIEVHVHLHRGERPKSSRSKAAARPVLTGKLFDWQWYHDRLSGKLRPPADKPWALATTCQHCGASMVGGARHCPRCAAPRSRRFLPAVIAVVGLAAVAAVFLLCVHVLGGSTAESKTPKPLGQWTDDGDYLIVEVPATPSPFSAPPASGTASAGGPH